MMQRRSSSSAGAVYLDRDARLRALEEMAERAAGEIAGIERIVLFGSMVEGIPTPRSDADLLVEVSATGDADPRDRAAAVRRAMEPLPCPIDLFVFTTDELAALLDERAPLVTRALERGREIFRRAR